MMGLAMRQATDVAFLNDMVSYMHNQGAANDGKHANLLSMMWCARPARVLPHRSCSSAPRGMAPLDAAC